MLDLNNKFKVHLYQALIISTIKNVKRQNIFVSGSAKSAKLDVTKAE